jgi:hypothetical protein
MPLTGWEDEIVIAALVIGAVVAVLVLAAIFDARRRHRASGPTRVAEKRAEMVRDEDTVTNMMMNRRGHSGPTQPM